MPAPQPARVLAGRVLAGRVQLDSCCSLLGLSIDEVLTAIHPPLLSGPLRPQDVVNRRLVFETGMKMSAPTAVT